MESNWTMLVWTSINLEFFSIFVRQIGNLPPIFNRRQVTNLPYNVNGILLATSPIRLRLGRVFRRVIWIARCLPSCSSRANPERSRRDTTFRLPLHPCPDALPDRRSP